MESTEETVSKQTQLRTKQAAKALNGASLSLLIRFVISRSRVQVTFPAPKNNHTIRCGYFLVTGGDFTCSGGVNPPCAKVLPAAKRSHGAKAPPARRPVLSLFEEIRCGSKCGSDFDPHRDPQAEITGKGRRGFSSSPALSAVLCYSTCAMKFPIFSAAFSCIRRLVWV